MSYRYWGVELGVLALAFAFVVVANLPLGSSPQLAQLVPTQNLQASWSFNEGSGSATTRDSVTGNNSTVSTSWTAPGYNGSGSALRFTRAAGTVSLISTNTFNIGSTFSVSLWVKPQSANSGSFVPVIRRGQFVYPFMLSVGNASGGTVQIQSSVRTTSTNRVTATVSSGVWHHIAVVYNGSTHTLYVDGAAVASSALTGAPLLSGTQETVAGLSFGGTTGFDGDLDEVKVYNAALSATDVGALFGGTPPPSPFTVNVTKSGSGTGTVTSSPAGINCGSDCGESNVTSALTLTATPASGSIFIGWTSGGCSGTGSCSAFTTATINAQFDTSTPPPSGNARYIRPTGYKTCTTSSPCDGSSWANAFNGQAGINWSAVQPGTTLYVAGGDYGALLTVGASGTSGSDVVIKRATAAQSGVTGWNSSFDSVVQIDQISLLGRSYVTIDGSVPRGMYLTRGLGIGFANSQLVLIGGSTGSLSTNITLRNLELEGPGYLACLEGRGVAIGGDGRANNVHIDSIYIHDFGSAAIRLQNHTGMLIENSTFSKNQSGCSAIHGEEVAFFGDISGITVRNNTFTKPTLTGGTGLSFAQCSNAPCLNLGIQGVVRIYNNVFYNAYIPIRTDSAAGAGPNVTSFDIYNNTFVGWRQIVQEATTNASPKKIVNNIICNLDSLVAPSDTRWPYTNGSSLLLEHSNNLFCDHSTQNSAPYDFQNYGANAIQITQAQGEALFTAAGTGNLHITGGSQAVNTGLNLSTVFNFDADGITRPQGSAWDMGAYEFVGSGIQSHTLTVNKSGTGSGTVTSSPSGINCGTGCSTMSSSYAAGTIVTLTASVSSGSTFTGWGGACTGTGICSVSMTQARSVTATFSTAGDTTNPTVTLTAPTAGATLSGTANLTANASDNVAVAGVQFLVNGANFGTEDIISPYALSWNTLQPLSPNGSYTISARARDGAGNQSTTLPITVTVNNSRTLTVTKGGTGAGTVSSSPTGINCGSDCSEVYAHGTSVVLSAVATSGSTFSGWSGACSGTDSCTVLMDASKTATANFTLVPTVTRALTVSKSGTGSGTVTSSPAGINCGGDCTENYNDGTSVVLSAVATSGSTFSGWGGACTGTGTCTVSMTQARTVTATFSLTPQPCTLSSASWSQSSVIEGNTVVMSLVGTNCSTESIRYNIYESDPLSDDLVTPTPIPGTGLSRSWQTIYMDDGFTDPEYFFTAEVISTGQIISSEDFAPLLTVTPLPPQTFTLIVSKTGNGTGSVTSLPTGINCGNTCSQSYAIGSAVTLTAIPSIGSVFEGWTGVCSSAGTAPCQITINSSVTVGATFSDASVPIISNVRIFSKTATSFTVAWNTNELATSGIEYGTTPSYGSFAPDEGGPTTDFRVILEGLKRNTTYYFRVRATDLAGNVGYSSQFSTTTESRLQRPPKVNNVSAQSGSVILSWENPTDYEYFSKTIILKRTGSFVETPDTNYQVFEATSTTWRDESAEDGTNYYYTIFTKDDQGNYSDPEFISFTPGRNQPPSRGGGGGRRSPLPTSPTYGSSATPSDPLALLRAIITQWLLGMSMKQQPAPTYGTTGTVRTGGGFGSGVVKPAPVPTTTAADVEATRARLQNVFNVLTQLVQILSIKGSGR